MKIGVIGFGTVGEAIAKGFNFLGYRVYVNDKEKFAIYSKKYLMENCDVTFICVQTPPKEDGSIDLSRIYEVIDEVAKYKPKSVIVIKSTVTPGTTVKLSKEYPEITFAVNPEFLRHKHALTDFINPSKIVIGAEDRGVAFKISSLYSKIKVPKIITDPTTAETIKYINNAFLSLKVAFSNEVKNICETLKVDPREVMYAVCLDRRINPSHLDPVKGLISGKCLPKDLYAIIKLCENKCKTPLLKATSHYIDKKVQLYT